MSALCQDFGLSWPTQSMSCISSTLIIIPVMRYLSSSRSSTAHYLNCFWVCVIIWRTRLQMESWLCNMYQSLALCQFLSQQSPLHTGEIPQGNHGYVTCVSILCCISSDHNTHCCTQGRFHKAQPPMYGLTPMLKFISTSINISVLKKL